MKLNSEANSSQIMTDISQLDLSHTEQSNNKIISNDKYQKELNNIYASILLNLDLKKPSLINTINSDLLVNKKTY